MKKAVTKTSVTLAFSLVSFVLTFVFVSPLLDALAVSQVLVHIGTILGAGLITYGLKAFVRLFN
ncbi:MAG: hypothetical protein AAF376_15285 [Pseudomonadota bacterium]